MSYKLNKNYCKGDVKSTKTPCVTIRIFELADSLCVTLRKKWGIWLRVEKFLVNLHAITCAGLSRFLYTSEINNNRDVRKNKQS